MPTLCQTHPKMAPKCCQNRAKIMTETCPKHGKHTSKNMPKPWTCQKHTKHMPNTCQHHVKIMQKSQKHHLTYQNSCTGMSGITSRDLINSAFLEKLDAINQNYFLDEKECDCSCEKSSKFRSVTKWCPCARIAYWKIKMMARRPLEASEKINQIFANYISECCMHLPERRALLFQMGNV